MASLFELLGWIQWDDLEGQKSRGERGLRVQHLQAGAHHDDEAPQQEPSGVSAILMPWSQSPGTRRLPWASLLAAQAPCTERMSWRQGCRGF